MNPRQKLERSLLRLPATKKFLFELDDGNVVESVWMKYKHGNSKAGEIPSPSPCCKDTPADTAAATLPGKDNFL